MKVWILILFLMTISDAEITKCVVGEASNQGYKGMLAVAETIRHRIGLGWGLKGIYGCSKAEGRGEPMWVWKMAKKAVSASKNTNISCGATHWENVGAFGKPPWAKAMTITVVIGDHTFYKER